jgi:molecular chaperone DnaJ
MSNDFYEPLELNKNCSQEDIASAFRRLSIKNHPGADDKSKDYANKKYFFNRITEAYEILSDRKLFKK